MLDDGAPIDRRIEAALAMAADPAGAQLLIQLAAQNKVAYQLREAIGVGDLQQSRSQRAQSAAAGFFARPGGQPRMTVDDVGEPRRRRRSAARPASPATCSTCHRTAAATAGAEVGPDLTDIDKKFDRSGLIEAIVNPSAAIAFGFGAELFVTRQQRTDDRIPPVGGRHDLDSRWIWPGADHPAATISPRGFR